MPSNKALDHYQQGQIYEQQQQYTQALSAYQQAVQLDPTIARFHLSCGKMHSLLGAYQNAERACRQAIQLDETLIEAYNEYAYVLRQLQEYESALKLYRKATALDPTNADAHNGMGITLGKLQRFPEAIGAFRIALRLEPGNPQYHHNLGRVFQKAVRYADALEEFNQALKIDPTYTQAYYHKGQLLLHIHKEQEAFACLAQAKKLEPDNKSINAEYNRAITMQKAARQEPKPLLPSPTQSTKSALRNPLTNSAKKTKTASSNTMTKQASRDAARLKKAQEFYQKKQFAASLTTYREILNHDIHAIDAWQGAIQSLIQLRRWNEALKMCNNACIRVQEVGPFYYLKGEAFFGMKNYEEAKIAYTMALTYGYMPTSVSEKMQLIQQRITNAHSTSAEAHMENVSRKQLGPPPSQQKPDAEGNHHKNGARTPIAHPSVEELKHIPSLLERGEAFLKYRYYREAQQTFEQLLETEKENAQAYFGLGCAYRGVGEEENSLNAFHKAQKYGL